MDFRFFEKLTDDEAKASLTTLGCKAYNQYANARMTDSSLLTPIVDSSDDESLSSSLLITHNLRTSCSSHSSAANIDLNSQLSE